MENELSMISLLFFWLCVGQGEEGGALFVVWKFVRSSYNPHWYDEGSKPRHSKLKCQKDGNYHRGEPEQAVRAPASTVVLQNKIESNPLCIQNGMRNSLLEKTDYALLGPSNLNGIHSTYAPAVVDSVFTKEDSCWLRALPWVQEFSNSYHIYSITVELNMWIWNGFGIVHLVGIHVHLHHQYRMELRMLYGVPQQNSV